MNNCKSPTKFVGLHNHTGFSTYDGLGYPDDHFKFCIENGLDAHVISEHGHFNSYAHAQLWAEDWNKANKDRPFKYIPGIEAYYHPDLEQWRSDKARADARKEEVAAAKKAKKAIVVEEGVGDIDMSNALTIENEDETKGATAGKSPVNRRHHLVLLPKTSRGLTKLFAAASLGYLKGFYRFPRIDTSVLREAAAEKEIIALSACIGGPLAAAVFQTFKDVPFDALDQSLLDDAASAERCMASICEAYVLIADAVGKENFYLELQFNRIKAQNLVNRALIQFARLNGLTQQLVVTCDAHYYSPNVWKERELYKRLGFMNYTEYTPDSLPKSREELKCELYPKNAAQLWAEYLRSKEGTTFYDDREVCEAIERTWHVAHEVIGDIKPDRSPKFANERLVPKGKTSFEHLVDLCKEGLVKRGLSTRPEYVARLKEELSVIKAMKNADYFISYQKIMQLARNVALLGPARGSGGGSLINYVLYITDLDPIKWDLPFSRFLSIHRCLSPETRVLLSDRVCALRDVNVGDNVITHDGTAQKIVNVFNSRHKSVFKLKVNGSVFVCSPDHEWIIVGPDKMPIKKKTSQLAVGDVLYTYHYERH